MRLQHFAQWHWAAGAVDVSTDETRNGSNGFCVGRADLTQQVLQGVGCELYSFHLQLFPKLSEDGQLVLEIYL